MIVNKSSINARTERSFDVVVIGGGAAGVMAACAAAQAGCSVLLAESGVCGGGMCLRTTDQAFESFERVAVEIDDLRDYPHGVHDGWSLGLGGDRSCVGHQRSGDCSGEDEVEWSPAERELAEHLR